MKMTIKELHKKLDELEYQGVIQVFHNNIEYTIHYDYDNEEWDITSYYKEEKGIYKVNDFECVDYKYQVVEHIYGSKKND